jgi:hypothetical protein
MSRLLVPSLANVDDVDSIWSSLPEVRFHVNLQVLGSKVALSCEEHLYVLGGGIENGGKVRGSHLCDLTTKMVKSVKMVVVGCGIIEKELSLKMKLFVCENKFTIV